MDVASDERMVKKELNLDFELTEWSIAGNQDPFAGIHFPDESHFAFSICACLIFVHLIGGSQAMVTFYA